MHVEVPAVSAREITRQGRSDEEVSSVIRGRVESARQIQSGRFGGTVDCNCNAQMGLGAIEKFCHIDERTRALLQKAIESLSLSARAAHRSLRVARTIADLVGSEVIQVEHIAEAVQYQAPDRATQG